MGSVVRLHTTYFGPIQWYQQLYRSDGVFIDTAEPYIKQTIRNHCLIAGPNGVQKLTVPVSHPKVPDLQPKTNQIRISSHGNWQRQHWHALQTAYGDSPFFMYYEDDLRPFFTEEPPELLVDFNASIVKKMCELLDISHPRVPAPPHLRTPENKEYYQVFRERHGFLPNLSILDLLFNMGNEAILYL
ncbi:MAG: WbqC family protein [Prevotella sp.]|nr:WbqC family protein [Prevotella sp.]